MASILASKVARLKKQCIYLRTETEQMKIQKNLVYTIKEASNLTGISTRTLSRAAKKHNLERIDSRYIFTGDFILETFKKQLKKVASPKNNGEDNGEDNGEARKAGLKRAGRALACPLL